MLLLLQSSLSSSSLLSSVAATSPSHRLVFKCVTMTVTTKKSGTFVLSVSIRNPCCLPRDNIIAVSRHCLSVYYHYSDLLFVVGPGLRSCISQGPHTNNTHCRRHVRRCDLHHSIGQVWSQTDFSIQSLGDGRCGRGQRLCPELLRLRSFEILYRSTSTGMST